MLKIGILFIALAAVAIYFVIRSTTNSPVRGSTIDIENYIDGLVGAPDEDGVLIITISGTSKFVQFNGGGYGVQMDFPLVTPEQKSMRASIETGGKEMGLVAIINLGTDGSEFIDFDLNGNPSEISKIVESFMAKLYGTNQSTQLEFVKHGY
jgi:hypothetical protein